MNQPTLPPVTLAGAVAVIESLHEQLLRVRRAFDDTSEASAKAIAQAEAFVQAFSDAVAQELTTTRIVGHLGSGRYDNAGCGRGPDFVINIVDRANKCGQVELEVSPAGGHIDDFLSVVAEIAPHPQLGIPVPSLRIHNDGDTLASVFNEGLGRVLLATSSSATTAGVLRIREAA